MNTEGQLIMIKVSEETCPLLSNGLEGGVMSGTNMGMSSGLIVVRVVSVFQLCCHVVVD
jgi:hypothetical protein